MLGPIFDEVNLKNNHLRCIISVKVLWVGLCVDRLGNHGPGAYSWPSRVKQFSSLLYEHFIQIKPRLRTTYGWTGSWWTKGIWINTVPSGSSTTSMWLLPKSGPVEFRGMMLWVWSRKHLTLQLLKLGNEASNQILDPVNQCERFDTNFELGAEKDFVQSTFIRKHAGSEPGANLMKVDSLHQNFLLVMIGWKIKYARNVPEMNECSSVPKGVLMKATSFHQIHHCVNQWLYFDGSKLF